MARSRAGCRPLWLIARHDHGGMNVLTINHSGSGEMLPVFSYQEEAETFLWLGGAPGMSWCVRETTAGELASVLYGPCARVERVALDPLPAGDRELVVDLADLGRERFLRNLIGIGGNSSEARVVKDAGTEDGREVWPGGIRCRRSDQAQENSRR